MPRAVRGQQQAEARATGQLGGTEGDRKEAVRRQRRAGGPYFPFQAPFSKRDGALAVAPPQNAFPLHLLLACPHSPT